MNKEIDYSKDTHQSYEVAAYDIGLCFPETAVFIKEDECNGKNFWAIYDAEGTRIAVTDDRECAFVLARQNDFIPSSVH